MSRSVVMAAAFAAVLVCGCGGGPKTASVSGVVTLDGQPYPNAVVSFQPQGGDTSDGAGVGSTGLTDENGRYTLSTVDGKGGAVVGKHKVRIQTKRETGGVPIDPTVGSEDSTDPKKKVAVDPIPADWYANGREFTVPAAGTDKADFAIESVKVPPKKK